MVYNELDSLFSAHRAQPIILNKINPMNKRFYLFWFDLCTLMGLSYHLDERTHWMKTVTSSWWQWQWIIAIFNLVLNFLPNKEYQRPPTWTQELHTRTMISSRIQRSEYGMQFQREFVLRINGNNKLRIFGNVVVTNWHTKKVRSERR